MHTHTHSLSHSLFQSINQSILSKEQTSTVSVTVYLDTIKSTNDANYQTYGRGISLIPLIFILLMSVTTRMVEISLFLGILVGSCIITGSLNDGFKLTCNEFLVGALTDEGHVYIILFTVFLSGAVGMMVSSNSFRGLMFIFMCTFTFTFTFTGM
jgi:hypothetical protein